MESIGGVFHLSDSSDLLDTQVYDLLLKFGTDTINGLARRLNRKHETVAKSVQRLEESGKVDVLKNGNTRYVSVHPDSINKRVQPDWKNRYNKNGNRNEGYAHPSLDVPFLRAKSMNERVPIPGFVLHPQTRGCDVSREWVRMHVNGEYQIKVRKVGDFHQFNRNDDVAIRWEISHLNTNTAYNGKVFLKGADGQAYSIRAVSNRAGGVDVLSVHIHPRYIFHKEHETTALAEFRQQVKDVCEALEVHGWTFNYDSIELKGELHTGLNDPILASKVGRYNQTPGDSLHFDHSHGIPEYEVYGSDPDTVELMVNLPDTIRAMAESIELLTNLVNQIIDVQTKTITIMLPKDNENRLDVMFG